VPHWSDIELMRASNVTYYYPRHIHEECCFVMMLRGIETHLCRGKEYKAFPGDLMLLNADEAHSSISVETEYRVIHLHPDALNRIGFEAAGRKLEVVHFSSPVVRDSSLFRSLLNLHLKLELVAAPLEQDSDLISTLGLLLARLNKIPPAFRRVGKEPRRIETILDFLKSHSADNISLAELASMVSLSPFYLLRVFRKQTGIPPHEYQTQVRIARARKLIRKGYSISHVALETGFFDQSHLSRNFKRIVGVTPGQYLSQSKIVQYTAE
jgi:AraC-like DNA-binding protein